MTTNVIERTPLLAAIETMLEALNADVYLGEAGTVDKVPGDRLGRVAPYAVLMPFVGAGTVEESVAMSSVDLDWGFQLTIASGFVRDTLAVAEEADELLYRQRPPLDAGLGYVAGRLIPPPGYDPGLLPDKAFEPHRYFVPLQYRTTITST